MDNNEFLQKLKAAYEASGGDLWAFWAALNPDAPRMERTSKERIVFLYCNKRSNKDGTTWIKRVAKIDNKDVFELEFRTGTIPKYNGFIKLQDYILNEATHRIIVYKFDYQSAPKAADD